MGKQTTVSHLPDCDLCANGTKAKYDVRLPRQGCWANVCEKHFKQEGCALGTGLGQELIEETDKMDIREAIKQLAKGQGSYGRLDARLDELQAEDPDKYDEVMQELDAQNFKGIADLVMYLGDNMTVCTVCKKKFIPAVEHLYKTKDGKQCSYTCWNKAKPVVDKPRASIRRRQG